jgi:hypothetical protein
MDTILILNAVSSLLAAAGIGGYFAWERWRARRASVTQPLYISTGTTRPLRRD